MIIKFDHLKIIVNKNLEKSYLIYPIFSYLVNHQRRTSTVSTENDSDNEITTITDQSNTDFEKTFAETN
jgi:hypothetical protein